MEPVMSNNVVQQIGSMVRSGSNNSPETMVPAKSTNIVQPNEFMERSGSRKDSKSLEQAKLEETVQPIGSIERARSNNTANSISINAIQPTGSMIRSESNKISEPIELTKSTNIIQPVGSVKRTKSNSASTSMVPAKSTDNIQSNGNNDEWEYVYEEVEVSQSNNHILEVVDPKDLAKFSPSELIRVDEIVPKRSIRVSSMTTSPLLSHINPLLNQTHPGICTSREHMTLFKGTNEGKVSNVASSIEKRNPSSGEPQVNSDCQPKT
ncbi:hypothetical protein RDWZM_000293 [Blomia tropicalis]|uniref:Uncharacterized protein n=1 Tax=Blomia tropicalis TaxID=40697 RepID=A0A9Q0M8H6_BLOTA|nr:hypothetical protein RDWZM_000293 [Blomia tropicalis]